MVDVLGVFQRALQSMSAAFGSIGHAVKNKCQRVESNNPGLKTIKEIREIIIGEHEVYLKIISLAMPSSTSMQQ